MEPYVLRPRKRGDASDYAIHDKTTGRFVGTLTRDGGTGRYTLRWAGLVTSYSSIKAYATAMKVLGHEIEIER